MSSEKLLIFLCVIIILVKDNDGVDQYYWRDYYYGDLPADAINFTTSEEGQVGIFQAFGARSTDLYGVLPTYEQSDGSFYIALDENPLEANFPKVLCSNQPNKFSWISTTIENFKKDTDGSVLVNGGYLYNGRVIKSYIGKYKDAIGVILETDHKLHYVSPIINSVLGVFSVLVYDI